MGLAGQGTEFRVWGARGGGGGWGGGGGGGGGEVREGVLIAGDNKMRACQYDAREDVQLW